MWLALSVTEAVNETVVVVVGVPVTESVLPPVLETLKPLLRLTAVPLVGTAVLFTVKV